MSNLLNLSPTRVIVDNNDCTLSPATLTQLADDELDRMERQFVALVQLIRQVRGRTPLPSGARQRRAAREARR